ncbi:MAG TPA: zeta toxin family protein [Acidimicrobiales bacterium]|nr:MAG: ATPase [Actinobacteria bacterium 21-73-9]HQU25514.1 zeta toxin family protein [Acidimicrobiales bacterium]
MADPFLHVVAGPNGSGKSSFYRDVLLPSMNLPFVNPDEIARARWPNDPARGAQEASRLAAAARDGLIARRESFVTETVFSHSSKVDLIRTARAAGYLVTLHVVLVPLELTERRVTLRVAQGGHSVPPEKIRERYARLWALVVQGIGLANEAYVYDNSTAARPFDRVASYQDGQLLGEARWPSWTPIELR